MLQFPSDKTIKQACVAYRTKSGEEGALKFSFKGKALDENLTLAQANLVDGSVINNNSHAATDYSHGGIVPALCVSSLP